MSEDVPSPADVVNATAEVGLPPSPPRATGAAGAEARYRPILPARPPAGLLPPIPTEGVPPPNMEHTVRLEFEPSRRRAADFTGGSPSRRRDGGWPIGGRRRGGPGTSPAPSDPGTGRPLGAGPTPHLRGGYTPAPPPAEEDDDPDELDAAIRFPATDKELQFMKVPEQFTAYAGWRLGAMMKMLQYLPMDNEA